MSGTFQKGSSINLSGSPWNVTKTESVYVLYANQTVKLFTDAGCQDEIHPPQIQVPFETSTGLYFYIAASSDAGTYFTDGTGGDPLPVSWITPSLCPNSIAYGIIRNDRKAFSIKDYWSHSAEETYHFDLNLSVASSSGSISVARVLGVDPAIIEKPEDFP